MSLNSWRKCVIYALFLINLVVVVSIWSTHSGVAFGTGRTPAVMRSLSNISAILAVYLILIQLLLIGRTKWVEQTFGMDKLSRLHHWLGLGIPVLIIIHPVFLGVGAAWGTNKTSFEMLWRMVNYMEDVGKAAVATGLFIALVILSVLIVYKKLKYETWFYTHLIMYLAILLAFGHQLGSGDDFKEAWTRVYWLALYAFVLINLLYYRFFLPVWITWRHGFTVDRLVQESKGVWSIYIKGKDLGSFKVKAGQFFIFRFLDKKNWWQAHPFSLSCAPNKDFLRITVKDLGDFTSRIGQIKAGTRVLVDGPYGVFTIDKAQKDKFLLLAGGVGITPVRSLAQELTEKKKDAVLLYACRTGEEAILKNELDTMAQQSGLKVTCVTSDDKAWEGEKGFLDKEKIQRLAPDFMEREVYLCGPPPMTKAVLAALRDLGTPKSQIHFERFSF
jgi:predicted ferric reductase